MPKKHKIKLKKKEKEYLELFVKQGKKNAREINRARILLLANEQKTDKEIIEILKISRKTIFTVRKKYCTETLENTLKEKPRPGARIKIDSRVESNITMIACSEPPEGSSRWTMQLIADKLIESNIIEKISYRSVSNKLKKTT